MDALFPRCGGLDVHKANVIACVRIVGPDGKLTKHVRTFSTRTHALRELADWLSAQGVTHVAMESTGVFWKPVFHILEDRFTVQGLGVRPSFKLNLKLGLTPPRPTPPRPRRGRQVIGCFS